MQVSSHFCGDDWCLNEWFFVKAPQANSVGIEIVLLIRYILPFAIFAPYLLGT